MKFQDLVDKLTKYQIKIVEQIEKYPEADNLPPDLITKASAADTWLLEASNMKLGDAEAPVAAPNIDPMTEYANALKLYSGMFDEKLQSEITEFEELVDELFNAIKEYDVPRA